jgi:hypothetical protein
MPLWVANRLVWGEAWAHWVLGTYLLKEGNVLPTDVTDHRQKIYGSGRWGDEASDDCLLNSSDQRFKGHVVGLSKSFPSVTVVPVP